MSTVHRWRWGEPLTPLLAALERGAVIAVPTESSYGLAVDPRDERAVAAVHRLKGRDPGQPLPVVAAGVAQVEALGARLDDPLLARLSRSWPAPLSLLLPLERELPAAAGSGRVAVRVPAHRRLRELLEALGTALTATSANLSGAPPMTDPRAVRGLLAGAPGSVLVDDGVLPGGAPSTVVGVVREGRLEVLRRGAFPLETLAAALESISGPIFSAGSVEILADESR